MSSDSEMSDGAIGMSVAQWAEEYQAILNRPNIRRQVSPSFQAVEWALTGFDSVEGREARVEALRNMPKPTILDPYVRRDYDSVIGFTKQIISRGALFVYVRPSPQRALRDRLKVKVPFLINGKLTSLDPSKVPNTLLAMINLRHIVRVFFPGLLNTTRKGSALTFEESEIFYNQGILPAVEEAAVTIFRDWPPSYQSEIFRLSNERGHYSESTRAIAVEDVRTFSALLVQRIQQVSWGQNIVFGTEIRGIKDTTEHEPSPAESQRYLSQVFSGMFYPWEDVDGHWFVDVGVELHIGDKAIVWRTGCATPIMQFLRFNNDEIQQATQNPRLYEQDVSQHLVEAAGFRARLQKPLGPNDIWYIQAYTTDKSLTYHLSGNSFSKHITARQAMSTSDGPSYVQRLYDAYTAARRKKDVAARLEIRVPYVHAAAVLLKFPRQLFMTTTLVFPRELWWNVRIIRLHAAHTMLIHLNSLSPQARCSLSTLNTYAALVWLINGLHSRPPADQAGRCVAKMALPLTDDLEDDERTLYGFNDGDDEVPFSPGGMIFFRRMVFPPRADCARIAHNRGRQLPPNIFELIFEQSIVNLQRQMDPILRMQMKPPCHPKRFKVSHQRTIARIPAHDEENEITTAFTVLENIEVHPKYVHFGPDADQYHESLDDGGDDHVGKQVDVVWKQFGTDLVQKIGNPSGMREMNQLPSYCILPQVDRLEIKTTDLEDPNLAKYFRIVNIKRVNIEGWEKVFDYLFPCPNYTLPANARQYNTVKYYREWVILINAIPEKNVIEVRRTMKREFDKLAWAPAAKSDRIWDYKPADDVVTYPGGQRSNNHAPKIVWNPKRKVQPVWILGR